MPSPAGMVAAGPMPLRVRRTMRTSVVWAKPEARVNKVNQMLPRIKTVRRP